MYVVGQEINIGYYGGFHNQTKIISKAKIFTIDNQFITIHVALSHGGYREMFGYDYQLKELEENYVRWKGDKTCIKYC